MRSGDPSRGSMPEIYHVDLHFHAHPWSNGKPAQVYRFECVGRPSGPRWVVHAVWVSNAEPANPNHAPRGRWYSYLRSLISDALAQQLNREISPWRNDLITWRDE